MFKRRPARPGRMAAWRSTSTSPRCAARAASWRTLPNGPAWTQPVPPCQPWLVKDLLRHTGYIHRWAARHVTEYPDSVIDGPPEADILRGGAGDPDLLSWFRAGHAALVETLSTAPTPACSAPP